VSKKKVNENARKAAKLTCMMDYAKSNDCILWIHPWQNEHQWSVNVSLLCILSHLGGDWLQMFINEVLAAFIGKSECETLPAPS